MTSKEARQSLIDRKEWTKLLLSLPQGVSSILVDRATDIQTIQSVGARMNTNGESRFVYSFNSNKEKRILVITAKKREE